MWRGDFQERAGKGTADMRCCAIPNRVLQGRQSSRLLLQSSRGSAASLPRAEATRVKGLAGPLWWVTMRQEQKKEEKSAWGQSAGSKGTEDWGKMRLK